MVMSNLGKLEEEALKRKERLKNLKRKVNTETDQKTKEKSTENAEKIPK